MAFQGTGATPQAAAPATPISAISPKKTGRTRDTSRIFAYVVIALICLFSLFPLYWMLENSLRSSSDASNSVSLWPEQFHWSNYSTMWNSLTYPFHVCLINSFVMAGLVTIGTVASCALVAYGFARFRFFGREALAVSVLFSQLLPSSVVLIPLYLYFDRFHLIDSYPALILSYLIIVLPLCTWMLRGYFQGLPREIEEAGLIDGCSPLGVLVRLALPLAVPAIVATGLYAFTVAWDEFLFALTFTQSAHTRTLPVELAFFTGEQNTDWAAVMAASVLMSIPVVVIFLTFQRFFVRGLAEGAVKG